MNQKNGSKECIFHTYLFMNTHTHTHGTYIDIQTFHIIALVWQSQDGEKRQQKYNYQRISRQEKYQHPFC